MVNHLGDEALAGSGTSVALVADGRDNSRKQRRKRLLVTDIKRKGIWQGNT